jgi:hypothetical protein
MTDLERSAIHELGDKVDDLRRSVDRQIEACKACGEKVQKHDATLYIGTPKERSLVAQVQSLAEWKERTQFVERGIFGGALREIGRLAAMALVLAALLLLQSHLSGPASATVDNVVRQVTR